VRSERNKRRGRRMAKDVFKERLRGGGGDKERLLCNYWTGRGKYIRKMRIASCSDNPEAVEEAIDAAFEVPDFCREPAFCREGGAGGESL